MPAPTEGADTLYERVERDLRNRVRAKLGMAPADEDRVLTAEQASRALGINPSFELPDRHSGFEQAAHHDDFVQTLLFANELQSKLLGLYSETRRLLEEQGVAALFAMFGCVEWYDDDQCSGQPHYAPMLLLPVELERKLHQGAYTFFLSGSDRDNSALNRCFDQLLLQQFGLKLPDLSDNDSARPEAYFDTVEGWLARHKPKWKLRRYVQVGILHFSRLVMYEDLDPSKWDGGLTADTAFGKLMRGDPSEDRWHGPETPQEFKTEHPTPPLVTDSDASQFSVIKDALSGENLAVEGPPGTGKSQTIANLIAAALAANKTVLFVAEKMAALEVVYSRLSSAGLSEFCLNLHGTSARKTEVLGSLKKRLELPRSRLSDTQSDAIDERGKSESRLNSIASTMGETLGPDHETIHHILFQARRTADLAEDRSPERLRQLEHICDMPRREHENFYEQLQLLQQNRDRVQSQEGSNGHPLKGIERPALDPFVIEEIEKSVESALVTTKMFVQCLQSLPMCDEATLEALRPNLKHIADLPDELGSTELHVINKISEEIPRRCLSDFVTSVKQLANIAGGRTIAVDEEFLFQNWHSIESIASSDNMFLPPCTKMHDVPVIILRIDDQLEIFEDIHLLIKRISSALSISDGLLGAEIHSIVKILEFAQELPNEAIAFLKRGSMDDRDYQVVKDLSIAAAELRQERKTLETFFELGALPRDHDGLIELADTIESTGLFTLLSPRVRRARAILKNASIKAVPRDAQKMRALVERVISHRRAVDGLEARAHREGLSGILGVPSRGIFSDFNAWIAARDYLNRLGEESLHVSPEIRTYFGQIDLRLKNLLISPEVRLSIIKLQQNIGSLDNLASLDHLESTLVGYRTQRKELEKLHRFLVSAGVRDDLTITSLKSEVYARVTYLEKRTRIEAHQAKSILGQLFNGLDTSVETIDRLLHLSSVFDGLGILRSGQYPQLTPDRYEAIRPLLYQFETRFGDAESALRKFVEVAAVNEQDFVGAMLEVTPLTMVVDRLEWCHTHSEALSNWGQFLAVKRSMPDRLASLGNAVADGQFRADEAITLFEAGHYRGLARIAYQRYPILVDVSASAVETWRENFCALDREALRIAQKEIQSQLKKRRVPEGVVSSRAGDRTELQLLRHEISKSKNHRPIRDLFRRAQGAIFALTPCLLMSPMAIAQFLPRTSNLVDLVVIDEASQMRPEDALGAILRSRQAVIVGDPKQLPPTSFFTRDGEVTKDDDEDDDDADDMESILDKAILAFHPPRRLRWHYRSKHPSLVAFSNREFYDRDLILFPSPIQDSSELGISLRYVPDGKYRKSINPREAECTLEVLQKHILRYPNESVGIVALNQAQAEFIRMQLEHLRATNENFRKFLDRFDDGLEPVFVKNLENVQGDEREAIIISTVYGPDPEIGKVYQRFGPINRSTGWRRLNVLITRARNRLHVVTSMRSTDIFVGERSSRGLRALRNYFEFVETGRLPQSANDERREPESPFEFEVMGALQALGYEAVPQIGVEGFFIDLAVVDPNCRGRFLLGIECDGATYHSSRDARERDRLRQDILERLGWSIHRIWSTDWFRHKNIEIERLQEAIGQRLAELELSDRARLQASIGSEDEDPMQDLSGSATTEAVASGPRPGDGEAIARRDENWSSSQIRAQVGDQITVEKLFDDHGTMRFRLSDTANDPDSGVISVVRPLGQAILNAEEGEEVEYEVGVYLRKIRVISILRQQQNLPA